MWSGSLISAAEHIQAPTGRTDVATALAHHSALISNAEDERPPPVSAAWAGNVHQSRPVPGPQPGQGDATAMRS